MNNRERAARWFQRLYSEKMSRAASDEDAANNKLETIQQKSPESALRIILKPKFNQEIAGRGEYEMAFFIENTGKTTVTDYRVDVEFPSAFLQPGWHPLWEEPERQNKTHRFFRMTKEFFEAGSAKWTLYGKDKRRLFAITFHVDKDNYRAEFLNQTISVNVYSNEVLVDHVEQLMRDIVRER